SSMSAERDGPVMSCVYAVIFWPVPLRARSFTLAIASSSVGTIFSMPTTAMCTGGTLVARSALPSFVTSRRVPVSAMSAFPPVIPMSALRKYCRSSALATATSDAVSSGTGWPTTLAKSCATSSRVLWIAGAMRCDGRSRPSATRSLSEASALSRRRRKSVFDAVRAASPPHGETVAQVARSRRTGRPRSARSVGLVEEVDEVNDANGRRLAPQSRLDLHEAARIRRDHELGAGALDVPDLALEELPRELRPRDVVGARAPAAPVGLDERYHGELRDRREQRARLLAHLL